MRRALLGLVVAALSFSSAYLIFSGGNRVESRYVSVVEKSLPSTVDIKVMALVENPLTGNVHEGWYTGSGVFVSNKGHILTAAHLFPDNIHKDKLFITMYSGARLRARIIKISNKYDLALIRLVDPIRTPYAKIQSPSGLKVGQEVLAIGSPLGFKFSVSQGIISALNVDLGDKMYNLTQSDTAINPGNSGGPLFGLNGRLVGINVCYVPVHFFASFSGLGFSVQSGQIIEFITDCKKLDPELSGFSWREDLSYLLSWLGGAYGIIAKA